MSSISSVLPSGKTSNLSNDYDFIDGSKVQAAGADPMLRWMRNEAREAKAERLRQLGPDGLADKNTRDLQRIERKRRIADNYQKERASST